ncbi:MAG: hypothetical protein COT81_03125 [Candidatus Buchananbacteria bacterium CG10_big_fil_rev_8_21_14_0_10_42_9]|uniref:Uncharacterized protein n=1 Tax=Candidatus Buchananbacteria bacterium CG10_big_fil_rev_8_21_14_0_10_42_9 TaxID=1974526 RepID=A0A2H0W3F4_9BACT|nr:MAG: hypothetical protein COT81_03125 [Candidatus Buchananbacteria bacterium CG10_big_fil_rev_8_21_14_0_10_42_9]
MRKTADFNAAIDAGKIEDAERWLEYIRANREKFPQYDDVWFADRQSDLDLAKKINKKNK